jgi:isopenicillin N synthase-like dioxygenase
MIIPQLNTQLIDNDELEKLMRVGFSYVNITDIEIINKIKFCMQTAEEFFQKSPDEKNQWQLKPILNPGDLYQGYALRSQSKNTNAIEQLFFEPHSPFGPYENSSLIKEINQYFMNQIFSPIMKAIFQKLNLNMDALSTIITEPNRSYVFQLCPANGKEKNNIRLNEHKDFGFLTIVYFENPGLEVMYQNEWHGIPPCENCVVINLGNATELMTQGKCHSALHRVTNATDNRLSSVYFINPNYQREVRNLIDNTLIAASGEEFFKQQFQEYYEVEH